MVNVSLYSNSNLTKSSKSRLIYLFVCDSYLLRTLDLTYEVPGSLQ